MQPDVLGAEKYLFRLQLRRRLHRLDSRARKSRSQKILAYLSQSPVFQKAEKMLVYLSVEGEVETQALIRKALQFKKKVYAPAVLSRGKKSLGIYEIRRGRAGLKKNIYGIPEPAKRFPGKPEQLDLILVPALGFDEQGYRIGRGAGYYDRFLGRRKRAVKIGLAFREQVVKKLPHGRHDIRMDQVIAA